MLACALTYSLIFAAVVYGEGVRKQWMKNWDLDSAPNWKERRLPCAGKAAILPKYPSNSLFVGGDLTLGSLELPMEGEVILGADTNMIFDATPHSSCQDAEWSHHGEDEWYDPDAWSYPGYENSTYPAPVPDLHRPPCTRDAAAFPASSQSLYTLTLSPPTVFVASLSIGTMNYTTSEFAAYMRTKEGMAMFHGASSPTDGVPLYIESPGECRDMTGCLCGTEEAEATICRIKSPRCAKLHCEKPLEMTGFCCPLCGAEVTISHNNTMPLASVAALLTSHRSSTVMRGIATYLAKMNDQNYHIYFTAMDEGGNYRAASEAFKVKFNKELNQGGQHSALVATSSTLTALQSQGVAPRHLAATFITLIICLAIGAAIFYLRNRKVRPDLSFMFRRLESNSRRVSVVSDVIGGRRPSTASGVFSYSREGGLRFLNPIFNQSTASLAGVGLSSVSNENVPAPVSSQAEGQHENPVYTAYQSMSPEEQQASEEAQKARERILEAAGQIVASIENSQVHFKGRKLSSPSGNDLGAIAEEKESKQDENSFQDILEDKGTNASNMNSTADLTSDQDTENITNDPSQEAPTKAENESNTDTTIIIPDIMDSKATEDVGKEEDDSKSSTSMEVSPQQKKKTESSISVLNLTDPSDRKDSASTSSSDDDDASDALTSLEGFSPLVGLKFKKIIELPCYQGMGSLHTVKF